MPGEFIGMAEESGLIGALTEQVLHQSLAQIHCWDVMGMRLGLSINLTVHLLDDKDLPDRLMERAKRY